MTKSKMVAAFAAVTFIAVLSGAGDHLAEGSLPLATSLAALLWAQVRWPLTGLVTGICGVVAMRVAELTTGGWLWPVTLLYVSVVIGPRPRLRVVVGIAALHTVMAFNLEWTVLRHSAARTFAGVGPDLLWLTAALAVTVAFGNWRRWTRTAIEEQRTAERLRVAREVHDTVAHTLTVVGVHLNVAADALETAPDEARAALRLAQDVRRRAMSDLSSLVGVLRDDRRPPAEPLDLDSLVARVREAGLDARLAVTGPEAPLPVRTAAGLVVREALTNTVRHANATTVTVTVHYGPVTEVTVTDDGTGSQAPEGHGLTGMRERVEALGGSLTTDGGGGFTVHATIPS
ncbi:sensor histidine kinase [Dactylosporangium sp. NPDC005555]|uniref:sensor histidine kinase n=1 Tax=Dactylosporangium sp. NPDC005555 TaxID=3154889 RepID=UPI0033B09962